MATYLHKFDEITEFESVYEDDEKYIEPWVSCTLENRKVHYNKVSAPQTYSRTITYIDRANNTETTDTQTAEIGTNVTFTMKSAPSWDAEHSFIGWSTEEYPTYAQTQEAGFLKQAGDTLSTNRDITLYADYNTTFQGLINEGYVDLNVTHAEGFLNGMHVRANGYPKELSCSQARSSRMPV